MKFRRTKGSPTPEIKERVKMWKAGKKWVYGTLFFLGMTTAMGTRSNTVAAAEESNDTTTDTNADSSASTVTQGSTYALHNQGSSTSSVSDQTGSSANSGADSSAVSADATSAADDTVKTDITGGNAGSAAKTSSAASSSATQSSAANPDNSASVASKASSAAAVGSTASSVSVSQASAGSSASSTYSSDSTSSVVSAASSVVTSSAASEQQDVNVTQSTPTDSGQTSKLTPDIGYKSMLSVAEVDALNDTADDPTTDSTTGTDPTTTDTALPDGFSVSDPDYPTGVYHYAEDSDWYTFAEMDTSAGKVSFAIDRATQTKVQIGLVSGSGDNLTIGSTQELTSGQKVTNFGGFAYIFDDGDSMYVVGSLTYIFDVMQYPKGEKTSQYSGFAFFTPLQQSQTTNYVDQNGNEIAGSVTMTGLTGQKYDTQPSSEITGYEPTDSGNTSGTMSPWMTNGQTRTQTVYNSDGTKRGTITYTVVDVNAGTISFNATPANKNTASTSGTLTYDVDTKTAGDPGKAFSGYNVPNPYLPQTTNITYTYNASAVNLTIKYVDSFGNTIKTDDTVSAKFNEVQAISYPPIDHYTVNGDYAVDATNNPKTFTPTTLDADANTITLHYIGDPATLTVEHVDQDGNAIGTDTTLNGKYGQTLNVDGSDDSSFTITGYAGPNATETTLTDGDNTNVLTLTYTKIGAYHITTPTGVTLPTGVQATTTYTMTDNSPVAVATPTGYYIPYLLGYAPTAKDAQTGTDIALTQVDPDDITKGYVAPDVSVLGNDDINITYGEQDAQYTVQYVSAKDQSVIATGTALTGQVGSNQSVTLDIPAGYILGYNQTDSRVNYDNTLSPLYEADGKTMKVDANGQPIVALAVVVPEGGTTYTVVIDPLTLVDAPTSIKSPYYTRTHRTFTLTSTATVPANAPEGTDLTVDNGQQNVEYTRDYWVDTYGGKGAADTPLYYTSWNAPDKTTLDALTVPTIDGFTATITLTENRTGQGAEAGKDTNTYADGDALNAALQENVAQFVANSANSESYAEESGATVYTDTVTVTYVADAQTVVVQLVDMTNPDTPTAVLDANGNPVGNLTFTGTSGATVDYASQSLADKLYQAGYVLINDGTLQTTKYDYNDAGNQVAFVQYTKNNQYSVTPPNGQPATTTYTTDPGDPTKATGTVPGVPGYTAQPVGGTLAKQPDGSYILTPTDPTQPATVTYTADNQTVTVEFVAASDGTTDVKPSVTITGASDSNIDYTKDSGGKTINYVVDGYTLTTDGRDATTKFDDDDAAGQTVTLKYTANGDYTVTPPNGKPGTPTQYTTDPGDPTKVTGTVPNVPGYTPEVTGGSYKPVDPNDETKGYTLVPDDPAQPATVTYTANEQTVTVKFVDASDGTTDVKQSVTITGDSDSDIDYTKDSDGKTINYVVDGYTLTTDGRAGTTKFDDDDTANQTVTLKYTANGDYTVTPPDGQPGTPVQYTTDPGDPTKVTGTVPNVPGYTPTSNNGTITKQPDGSWVLTPTDPTQPATITYAANEQTVTVKFIDASDSTTEVKPSVTITGDSDSTIDYTKDSDGKTISYVVDGYTLTTDGRAGTTKFDDDDTANQTVTLTYTANGDYTVTPPDGQPGTPVQYTTDPGDPTKVTGTVPNVPGYTPTSDNGTLTKQPDGSWVLIPTDPTQPATITYSANEQTVTVKFVDASDSTTDVKPSVTITGASGSSINYTKDGDGKTINYVVDGYTLTTDGRDNTEKFDDDDTANQTVILKYTANGDYTVTPPNGKPGTPTQYTTDPGDPTKVTGTVPNVPGYTPTSNNGTITQQPDGSWVLKPADPTQPATVTYFGQEQTVNVNFLDMYDRKLKDTVVLTGASDAVIDYSSIDKLISGYVLVTDRTSTVQNFDHDIAKNQDVNLVYFPTEITIKPGRPVYGNPAITGPKAPGTPIDRLNPDGPKYPTGVDDDSLNGSATETIRYEKADGSKVFDSYTHTITYSRTATVNIVTGSVTYGAWVADGSDSFQDVESLQLDGYTPDQEVVKAVIDDSAVDVNLVVYYYPATMTVTPTDPKSTNTLVDPKNPVGPKYPAGVDQDNLNRTATETVRYVNGNDGSKMADSKTATINYSRTATVNIVTGEVTYGAWKADGSDTFPALDSPTVTDYTPDQATVPAFKDDTAADMGLVVYYYPTTLTVKPDDPKNPDTPVDPKNPDGPKYPAGVDKDSLNRTATETVRYVNGNDGSKMADSKTATITYSRTATVNIATGEVTYGAWVADGSDTFPALDST
ncbi:mucin-binding protein [Lacticaseibacillus pantheris]|uniref:mucin-binding protein n=1 Tax=Lacticaseibacillus pantheris TaxID=171523 RepID=UPI002659860F|nr:MucBP domain-containing protein [Lacticaseibacillus pantheris]WKF85078.1 KxYKxGKxW signal peptide domain-containing protein [Lacticaseibacillus pantheris]